MRRFLVLFLAVSLTACLSPTPPTDGTNPPPPPSPTPPTPPNPTPPTPPNPTPPPPAPPPSPPPTSSGSAVSAINAQDRNAVVTAYKTIYQGAANNPVLSSVNWSGNVANCVAGDTSSAFKETVIRRINYYRSMAGLPNVTWTSDASKASNAQAAALMMAANGKLSHDPPKDGSWKCDTASARAGAGSSNLAGGNDGPDAIDAYMRDNGGNNAPVGHRRWILYPPRLEMASGDVPNWNALFVFGKTGTRPSSPAFVPFPNPGFFPRPLNSSRWSFSMTGANFTNATVSVKQGASSMSVNVVHRGGGYGDPTLVWEMPGSAFQNPTNADQRFDVRLENVVVGGVEKSFDYAVTLVNP